MPADVNRAFDIGGPDVLTYRQMMQGYARAAGLPQRLIVRSRSSARACPATGWDS